MAPRLVGGGRRRRGGAGARCRRGRRLAGGRGRCPADLLARGSGRGGVRGGGGGGAGSGVAGSSGVSESLLGAGSGTVASSGPVALPVSDTASSSALPVPPAASFCVWTGTVGGARTSSCPPPAR